MPTTVYREQKRGRAVERAAREFLPKASEALAVELTAVGADEPGMPDGEELQRYAAKALAKAREAMSAADRAHREAMQKLPGLRERRDERAQETYRLVGGIRQALEGAYGKKPAAKVLGFSGPTPREPERLRTVIEVAARQLGDMGLALPELRIEGLAPDRQALAATLGQAHERFAAVLDELGHLERQVQALAQARDQAKARFRRFYVGWGRVLDGLYVVADQRELARRLRPVEPSKATEGEVSGATEGEAVPAEPQQDSVGRVHSVHSVHSVHPPDSRGPGEEVDRVDGVDAEERPARAARSSPVHPSRNPRLDPGLDPLPQRRKLRVVPPAEELSGVVAGPEEPVPISDQVGDP